MELNVEEKVRRYDEAIQKANNILEGKCKNFFVYNHYNQEMIEYIFSELKESEDEKIRKSIIAILNNYVDNSNTFKPKMIAWLEKQSMPQVRTGLEWANTIDDACDKQYSKKYAHGEYCHEQSFKWGFQEGVDWLEKQNSNVDNANKEYWRGYREGKQEILDKYAEFEKQCEQKPQGKLALEAAKEEKVDNQNCVKPADKVEPKFHEGDWIVDKLGSIFYVKEVYDSFSKVIDEQGRIYNYDNKPMNEDCHLWIIKDAKDGDVLCTYECCEPKIVFILKGIPKKHYALSYHCYYNIMYPHFSSDSEKGCLAPNDEDVKPATKEQRDLLFQKMKEAGYTFDFEKKELRKIEQKPWSEEDMKMIGTLVAIFEVNYPESFYKVNPIGTTNMQGIHSSEIIKWLKSLKERVQPQHKEWSEEDNAIRNDLINYFRGSALETSEKEVINWLKSIKDRALPQSKQEWSDVDKDILFRIINDLKFLRDDINKDTKYAINIVDVEREINWLKSLSPQNTWKPSDEQMHAFEQVYDWYNNNFVPSETLTSLYNDLKNLKE